MIIWSLARLTFKAAKISKPGTLSIWQPGLATWQTSWNGSHSSKPWHASKRQPNLNVAAKGLAHLLKSFFAWHASEVATNHHQRKLARPTTWQPHGIMALNRQPILDRSGTPPIWQPCYCAWHTNGEAASPASLIVGNNQFSQCYSLAHHVYNSQSLKAWHVAPLAAKYSNTNPGMPAYKLVFNLGHATFHHKKCDICFFVPGYYKCVVNEDGDHTLKRNSNRKNVEETHGLSHGFHFHGWGCVHENRRPGKICCLQKHCCPCIQDIPLNGTSKEIGSPSY